MAGQPNILFIMADQLAAPALPAYGNKVAKTPHLDALAAGGVVFDSAYCNFPICAPSRFSMLSGRLPHAIEAWDNAAEFPAQIPTMAHYLRGAGYRSILCGKMHFVGPDQLHGFDERLTTDIYPADFSWTPDWRQGPGYKPTGISMRSVVEAGPCVRSLQVDYDDEVEYRGVQRLYDLAREPQAQPFFLTVSFTHPHPPFVAPQDHWDRYRHDDIDMPRVAPIPLEQLDEHSRWLYHAHGRDQHTITDAHVRNARHAYYAMTSYVDDKVGHLLQVLRDTGLAHNTVVVFAVDHGEMLGERGMWYKQSFYEWSSRVPLIVSQPGAISPHRVAAHVSLVDLLPTFMDLATGGNPLEAIDPLDGASLMPLVRGTDTGAGRVVVSEYSSEGVCAASRMVRDGVHKYVYTRGLKPMLFDLATDPDELRDLAGTPAVADVERRLHARALQGWDPEAIHARILESQKRRLFLAQSTALSPGYPNWAYQPFVDESRRFIRGAGSAGPTNAKSKARFPYVAPVPPDRK
jgi:choline-sulfatase